MTESGAIILTSVISILFIAASVTIAIRKKSNKLAVFLVFGMIVSIIVTRGNILGFVVSMGLTSACITIFYTISAILYRLFLGLKNLSIKTENKEKKD